MDFGGGDSIRLVDWFIVPPVIAPEEGLATESTGQLSSLNFSSMTVAALFGPSTKILERIAFADGTVWTQADIAARLVAVPNLAPSPVADHAVIAADANANVSGNVLANDIDADGDVLGVVDAGTRAGLYGSLTIGANGSFTYAQNAASVAVRSLRAGESVDDVFGYVASDGALSAGATLTVRVDGVNDAPVAQSDAIAIIEGASSANLAGTLLMNDTDIDAGDTRSISAVNTTGTKGTLTFDQATQSVVYSPGQVFESLAAGAIATDSFSYTVVDALGASSTATVAVLVTGQNDAPVLAAPLPARGATAGVAFAFALAADTFTDIDIGDALTWSATLVGAPSLPAWLAFNPMTRVLSGTAPASAPAAVTVQVTATDSFGGSAGGQFSIAFGKNLSGTYANDVLTGTASNDILYGGTDGTDVLNGDAGDDTFLVKAGDKGTATFNGGAGFDTILGSAGNDIVRVSNLTAANSIERIDGGGGINILAAYWYGNHVIDLSAIEVVNIAEVDGGNYNDVITGTSGNDVLYGGTGGSDVLNGGAGNDIFLVKAGDSAVVTFNGGSGFDIILGSAGNDIVRVSNLTAANGIERVDGGAGTNVLAAYWYGNHTIDLSAIEVLNIAEVAGGSYDDVITGTAGNDVLYGGAGGNDVLNGGAGNDTFLVKAGDSAVVTFNGGAGFDTILGTAGDDILRVSNLTAANGVERIDGGAGTNILGTYWYGNHSIDLSAIEVVNIAAVNGGSYQDTLTGSSGADYLAGLDGNDVLNGAAGNDILQGGNGNDSLTDTAGANLFDGGAGNDTLSGGAAAEMFRGGSGNDVINTGSGADVIVFNAGDGQDVVNASDAQDNTLSLGGALAYDNLSFRKASNDLVLNVNANDRVTFKDWYAGTGNKSVLNMQVVAEAMAAFDATSSDPLRNRKVQTFDFIGLVDAFDAARAGSPVISSWALTHALLAKHLSSSDTGAIGGDLAHYAGVQGSYAAMGLGGAQGALGDPHFGTQAQAFGTLRGLQEGSVRLA